jgi:hypothetical protein
VFSPQILNVMSSKFYNLDMFSANVSVAESERLRFHSQLSVLSEDLPMIVIVTLLQASSTLDGWSPTGIVSLVSSTVSLLFALTVTCSSWLMVRTESASSVLLQASEASVKSETEKSDGTASDSKEDSNASRPAAALSI